MSTLTCNPINFNTHNIPKELKDFKLYEIISLNIIFIGINEVNDQVFIQFLNNTSFLYSNVHPILIKRFYDVNKKESWYQAIKGSAGFVQTDYLIKPQL